VRAFPCALTNLKPAALVQPRHKATRGDTAALESYQSPVVLVEDRHVGMMAMKNINKFKQVSLCYTHEADL
jgi:hypothetical protein